MWDSVFPAENSFLEDTSLLYPGFDLRGYVGSDVGGQEKPHLFPLGDFDVTLLVCVFLASALGSSVSSPARSRNTHKREQTYWWFPSWGALGMALRGTVLWLVRPSHKSRIFRLHSGRPVTIRSLGWRRQPSEMTSTATDSHPKGFTQDPPGTNPETIQGRQYFRFGGLLPRRESNH